MINTKIKVNIEDLIAMDTNTWDGSKKLLNILKETGINGFSTKDIDRIAKEKYNLELRGSKTKKFQELVDFEDRRAYILEFRENY